MGDIPVTGFKSDKARALLAFLAMEGEIPHTRASLATLLWPDLSEQTAHSNLRSVLANLRSIIEKKNGLTAPILLADYQTLQLKGNAITCDVTTFERRIAAGQLKEAVSVYRGRLLQEFYSSSPLFDDWQQMRADALHQKAMQAFTTLIQINLNSGNLAQALQYAQQQLTLDPLNEDAHQNAIYLLALNGQISAALSQAAVCSLMLMKEMGVKPSPETLALEQAILKRQKLPVPRLLKKNDLQFLASTASQVRRLVPRETELKTLNAHLAEAMDGNGKIIFVSGDAGSGKTTLIEAFAAQAAANYPNLITLSSTCTMHTELATPFYPFHEVITQLTHSPEQTEKLSAADPVTTRPLDSLNSFVLKVLNEVAPDLEKLLRLDITTYPIQRTDQRENVFSLSLQRSNLYQQSADLLVRLSNEHPLLITLDDLQWIDADSLDLLHFLGTRLKGQPILVVGAYRCDEVNAGSSGKTHLLENYLHEFQRLYGDNAVDLNQSDGRAFVDDYLNTTPNRLSQEFHETLYQHTGGHALFTVELVESLKKTGYLNLDEQHLWVDRPEIDWNQLPARVEAIIQQRLKRLPVFWQHALAVASVEGETFTGEVLAAVLDSQPSTIIQGLSRVAGRQHGLVKLEAVQMVNGQRLSIFRFRHSIYQNYLYQRLDAAEHSILNEAFGNVLENIYRNNENTDAISARLAYHFKQGGQAQKAAGYYYRSGHAALQASAFLEAENHLNCAYALLQSALQNTENSRLAMRILDDLSLVDLALYGWGSEERNQILKAANQVAMHTGTESEQLLINTRIIGNLVGGGALQTADQKSLEILSQSNALEMNVDTIHARMIRSISSIFLGHLREGLSAQEEVFAYIANHRTDPAFRGKTTEEQMARVAQVTGLLLTGWPVQAETQLKLILASARQDPSPLILGIGLTIGGITKSLLLEDDPAVCAYAQELIDTPALKDFQAYLPWIEFMDGWLDFNSGQQRAGLKKLKHWGEQYKTGSHFLGLPFLYRTLADSLRQAGQAAAAERIFDFSLQTIEKGSGSFATQADFIRLRGECQLAQGDAVKAEASFREAILSARKQGATLLELKAATSLVRLKTAQGSASAERACLSQVYASFSEGWDTAPLKTAAKVLNQNNPDV